MANHEGVGGSAEQQRESKPTKQALELHPCPFCGCTEIQIVPNGMGDYFAICGDDEVGCGARSDSQRCESRSHAAERWNKRPDDYDWKAHAALSDKEFCQMEDWLIGNADFDKDGLVNRYERCKERIRDLIAKEGELGDLKAAKPLSTNEVGK